MKRAPPGRLRNSESDRTMSRCIFVCFGIHAYRGRMLREQTHFPDESRIDLHAGP